MARAAEGVEEGFLDREFELCEYIRGDFSGENPECNRGGFWVQRFDEVRDVRRLKDPERISDLPITLGIEQFDEFGLEELDGGGLHGCMVSVSSELGRVL
jgi:hypothetical protein